MALPNLLSLAGLIAWLGYELVLRNRNPSTLSWRAGRGDRGSTYLVVGAYLVVTVLINVLHSMPAGHLQQRWRWAGVVMIILGLLLRGWGMRALGTAFSRTLRAPSDQGLVQAGPYRLIRHPGYAGSLLVWTGYALGSGNWINAALAAAILLAAYTWRISAEEKVLADAFGSEYVRYSQHTKRLVPFLY
jgi:protein-S-isoprenylcysteine O-methyltransferase